MPDYGTPGPETGLNIPGTPIPGPETGLQIPGPTSIIPGSAEQKLLAARERPVPPDMTPTLGSRIGDALQVLAAGLGGLSSAGLDTGGPAPRAEAKLLQLQQEYQLKKMLQIQYPIQQQLP